MRTPVAPAGPDHRHVGIARAPARTLPQKSGSVISVVLVHQHERLEVLGSSAARLEQQVVAAADRAHGGERVDLRVGLGGHLMPGWA